MALEHALGSERLVAIWADVGASLGVGLEVVVEARPEQGRVGTVWALEDLPRVVAHLDLVHVVHVRYNNNHMFMNIDLQLKENICFI